MEKSIVILGSTGSIGTQALDVARAHGYRVRGLAAGKNVKLLEQQAREFLPEIVAVSDENAALELKTRLADTNIKVLSGDSGVEELATYKCDTLLNAIVGIAGLKPTLAAINAGNEIALSNKETLVAAGDVVMKLAAEKGVRILPVDSEHSAIFQCLQGVPEGALSKILLTASGGPFRGKKREELADMTVEDALKHPNWSMGRKITIDSSTLVNKGLEVIEAKWLFGTELSKIQVVVHPQSIIHSMVEFVDGGIMAQLGAPDMKLPIQYALFYPDRRPMEGKRVNFYELGQMTFEAPDMETFRGLALALKAGEIGGSMPTVYNAANECAVALFLDRKIRFLQIAEIIEASMEQHKLLANPTVDEILAAEAQTYEFIRGNFE